MTPEQKTVNLIIYEDGKPTGEIVNVVVDNDFKQKLGNSLNRQSKEGEDAPDEF